MAKEYKARFKLRSDTASSWETENPILLEGELGLETDTGLFKCGDGSSAWSSLSYNRAEALTEDAGSLTQPVYFEDGKPVPTGYTLEASVPADAVFTDTTYSEATEEAAGLMSAEDKAALAALLEGTAEAITESDIDTIFD